MAGPCRCNPRLQPPGVRVTPWLFEHLDPEFGTAPYRRAQRCRHDAAALGLRAMDAVTTAAVLTAAGLHAGWNAAVKRQADPLLAVAGLAAGGVLCCLLALPWLPRPDAAAWPYLAASVIVHVPYQLALANAYRRGELGTLYALMRGTPPLLVAILTATVLQSATGDRLSPTSLCGVAVLCGGLLALLRARPQPGAALAFAATAAACTATYTLLDGLGARAAGSAAAYVCWHGVVQGSVVVGVVAARLGPGTLGAHLRAQAPLSLGGGVASMLAYALVLWAMTRAPIATVAALRETSVLIAAWLGVWLFGEPQTAHRWVATALVVTGGILMRVG